MNKNNKNLLQYIETSFIDEAWKLFKFLIIYTLSFLFLAISFKYAIPFVIAFIIALLLQPLKNKIIELNSNSKIIKLSNGFVSFIIVIMIIVLLSITLGSVAYNAFQQSIKILEYLTNPNLVNEILLSIENYTKILLSNFNNLQPAILQKINDTIMIFVEIVSMLAAKLGKTVLNFIFSIPTGIITTLITIISTYFFTKEMTNIKKYIKSIFSNKGIKLIRHIKENLNSIVSGYVKAYLLIMLLVGSTSFIVFKLTNIEHSIFMAIFTAIIDFLPILGSGLIYSILAIKAYLDGNTLISIILIIGHLIICLIKQLLEQSLVASFIGLHPLVMIIGLFIALSPLGFLGMAYFIGAFLLYRIVK